MSSRPLRGQLSHLAGMPFGLYLRLLAFIVVVVVVVVMVVSESNSRVSLSFFLFQMIRSKDAETHKTIASNEAIKSN